MWRFAIHLTAVELIAMPKLKFLFRRRSHSRGLFHKGSFVQQSEIASLVQKVAGTILRMTMPFIESFRGSEYQATRPTHP